MSGKGDGQQNPQSAKVLQLGFNISVSGDPDTDFQILLDDKQQKSIQLSADDSQLEPAAITASKQEIEKKLPDEVNPANSTGAIPKQTRYSSNSSDSSKSGVEKSESHKDSSLINDIKNTMDHFEKFSDHLKEIPRLRNHPLATSTPFSDKQNSKSESSLIYSDYRPRRFTHLYDFQSRRDYFKGSIKPLPPDLFLKPLPGEDCYKRLNYTKFVDLEPYRHYGSVDSLSKVSDYKSALCPKSKYEFEKYDLENLVSEAPVGILKKSDSESGDKLSTSSADSVKDIKIYQSGGILIMQNFKDNLDVNEKKEISDFSAKLIENCHKLRDEITSGFPEDKFVCDEGKTSGKMVQFDLSGFGSQNSKSSELSSNVKGECSPVRMESSESTSDCVKIKDTSPQGTSQSQDFPSISTQDDSVSNQPGMSPTYTSGKKLEWDSGADVGYLNLDLSKENLSTIERIVLKGISSDGLKEKKVVYEKKPELTRSKFILERLPSDALLEEDQQKTENKEVKGSKANKEKIEMKSHEDEKTYTVDVSSKEAGKDKSQSAEDESLARKQNLGNQGSPDKIKPKNKTVESTDKSVNVNTLFTDSQVPVDRGIKPVEPPSRVRASKLSPKIKKLKKKKVSSSQRNITGPLKDKIDSIIDIARHSSRSKESTREMGVPKKIYKTIEANPQLNDLELSREVEEIIIDQRFKIKQSVAVEKSKRTPTTAKTDEVESKKEAKTKSRPISASSSSNNTVLPNAEVEKKETNVVNKFTDQIIQTNNCEVESVGIQAFASLKTNEGESKKMKEEPKKTKNGKESVNMSSKNIQAFGLNSSLPKELAHSRETQGTENQNSKSTQFFGGPINSLPNYHSNLLTKPGESCGRMPKVLKAKKNLEAEIIRLKEENEKNIMANDVPKVAEPKRDRREDDNKENLITEKSSNSKRSQSNASKGNRNADSKEKELKPEKKTVSPEDSECLRTSEEVSSKILTSEVLKEHGDSIDRNIIQEKYFQSQLVEIEKREMISRSTSMEKQLESVEKSSAKELVTVGCQYSPLSRKSSEEGSKYQEPDCGSFNETLSKRKETEPYDSSQNFVDEERFGTSKSTNQEQVFGAGDSLPSSTQTAHSWIPGVRGLHQNSKSGVGRARSFEYLPGDIYESSGNLREELPSETDQNLITSGSSRSNTGKHSMSVEVKDSEGRQTLVLENSTNRTEPSHESDRLKILSENLTQLDLVVSKLREKDTQIETITQTLLVNLWRNNGSGDSSHTLDGAKRAAEKPKEVERKGFSDCSDARRDCGDSSSEMSSLETRRKRKVKEISIACQTEEKSSTSGPEKFFEERKALERRISVEKESQIKWIENEIHHLNILRGLLEKQNFSSLRKKKSPSLTLSSNGEAKSEEKYQKEISGDVYPPPVTPVYGCTISLVENKPENCPQTREDNPPAASEPAMYGMAVSLTGGSTNLQRVVMLPVGVQVTLKDNKQGGDCADKSGTSNDSARSHIRSSAVESISKQIKPCGQRHHHHHRKIAHSDIYTQYPSLRKNENNPAMCTQTSFNSGVTCRQCQQENCVCLSFSEKSCDTTNRSFRSKASERRESFKVGYGNNEKSVHGSNNQTTSDSTNAGVVDLESDPVSKCQKISAKCGSQGTESFSKSVHDANSKYPRQVTSSATNPGIVCRGLCQSNIYLNCEKPSEAVGGCRCSKIQVQKSSNCTCHIIKILGSRCCSVENESSTRKPTKKMENQCCQTDGVSMETKATGVEKFDEAKKRPCSAKPGDTESQRDISDKPPTCNCCCKKAAKEKPKDEHPRHYFLKIEETEVEEDSNESEKKRKSLEVITVTVPVKKAGKAKIYGNIREGCQSEQFSAESSKNIPRNDCKCCKDCPGSQKAQRRHEEPNNQRYQKTPAEKPESPRRVSYYPYFDYQNGYKHSNGLSSSSQEFYQGINPPNNSYTYSRSQKENCSSVVESCLCTEQDNSGAIQSEYDSHSEGRRQGRSYYDCENSKFQDGRKRKTYQNDKTCHDTDLTLDPRCLQDDRYNSDYYNYNKKEFMTKSELKREEEKRRGTHQPSLQECLSSNRPDFCSSAESRRQIISERAKERIKRHNNRMECLINLVHQCDGKDLSRSIGPKRIFTTSQMREATMKKYKKLPEVTGKIADEKKKQEYRTNKLMGDIYGKKLQIEALKGHINLSNSVSVLTMI